MLSIERQHACVSPVVERLGLVAYVQAKAAEHKITVRLVAPCKANKTVVDLDDRHWQHAEIV